MGGICLNWGCIPTKALLKSAQVFNYIQHAEDFGVSVSDSKADFDGIIDRSRTVANGMSKGIEFLMKKNKIDVINGFGKLISPKKVEVSSEENGEKQIVEAKHIILATGARARELPYIKTDGKKIIEYRKAMSP